MKMQNITGQVGARARCRTYCDDPRTWRPVAHLPKSTGSRTGPEEDDRAIDAMIRSGDHPEKCPAHRLKSASECTDRTLMISEKTWEKGLRPAKSEEAVRTNSWDAPMRAAAPPNRIPIKKDFCNPREIRVTCRRNTKVSISKNINANPKSSIKSNISSRCNRHSSNINNNLNSRRQT